MKIKKRTGVYQRLSLDKILNHIRKLCNDSKLPNGKLKDIDPDVIANKVVSGLYDGVESQYLNVLAAEIAIAKSIEHPSYADLALRLTLDNMYKNTEELFSEAMETLYENNIINDKLIEDVRENKELLNTSIDYSRDYNLTLFGYKTLEKSYLAKLVIEGTHGETLKTTIVERPQHMWMRVSLGLHKGNIEKAIETYNAMSQGYFTHATPTLFNSGTNKEQNSSCFDKDTLVQTLKGPIKISEVEINDEVVTHNGNIKKVTQIHKNLLNNRDMYELNLHKTKPIKVTGNHKMYTYNKLTNNVEWVSVEDLQKEHYICIPNKKEGIKGDENTKFIYTNNFNEIINNYPLINGTKYEFINDDNKCCIKTHWRHNNLNEGQNMKVSRFSNKINNTWEVNNVFSEFLGIWFGDGHIITCKQNKLIKIRGIGFTVHNKNKSLIDKIAKYSKRIFDIEVTYHHMKTQNIIQVLLHSTIIGIIFNDLYGKGFNGKFINKDMYSWDKSLVSSLLHGLISTDGCISKDGLITIHMSNVLFMRQLYYLCRLNGMDVSYGKEKLQTNGTQLNVQLSVPKDIINIECINKVYTDEKWELINKPKESKYNNKRIVYNDNAFVKYKNKYKLNDYKEEYVYTLGIEDDHSYSIEGIIAENCYLLTMNEDSMKGIYKTISDCAIISKWSGGIGVSISDIRAKGSKIKGTNGKSDGLVPMLKVFNETARYSNQGGGKRKGGFAFYLEPWHGDILEFLDLKKNQGIESERARDIFLAMWIPDLFMKRVEEKGDWYLMCPDQCPGLTTTYGEEFEELYNKYISEGKYIKKIKAMEVWEKICESQIETGVPYLAYKDAVNKKNMQKNIGVIKGSNLCCEITLYTSKEETAICNLASIALPKYVEYNKDSRKYFFNFEKLGEMTRVLVRNLNNVIDYNFYPVPEGEYSNKKNRPIGIGTQGLADVFFKLKLPFDSEISNQINTKIFETIQYYAISESIELAKKDTPYESYPGSPWSEGLFQHNLWGITNESLLKPIKEYNTKQINITFPVYQWSELRERLLSYGIRNSVLTTQIPTASTAQILGNTESIEAITSNIYMRKVLSGEFPVINKYLVNELINKKLWTPEVINELIKNNGSIQNIKDIPDDIKEVYKIVWEIKQRYIIDQSASRAPFIDMTQSLNLFIAHPNLSIMSSMAFYAWKQGLKTGQYYLRSKPAAQSIQFTIDSGIQSSKVEVEDDNCEMCSA